MTRPEIARKLHDMVDAWLDNLLADQMGDCNMAFRVTFRPRDGSAPITLVVGTETPPEDDD